jgi:hypothetical protein
MRSVNAIRARAASAALVLTLLTLLFIDARHRARGDEKAPAKALPAELAKT